MPYKDLRQFINTLEKNGEVQRINKEVNWNLEAGAILRRTYETNERAPFFQKITGYPPGNRIFGGVLSNYKRIALAMDMDPKSSYKELVKAYRERAKKRIKPIMVKNAPCKENILLGDDIDLFRFPAPMIHDGDGGRYLCSWHATITKDLDSDWVNWGMYRAMIHDKKTLGGLCSSPQHHAQMFLWKYEPRGVQMPFAIAIGPEPICTFMACSRIPNGVSEVEVAGSFRNEPVELVKCETVDLSVPATAEIVIEGFMPPNIRKREGPFGEFTGYRASPRDWRPIYNVTAVTFRNDPILTMSCMGMPIDESDATGAIERAAFIMDELEHNGVPFVDVAVWPETISFIAAVSVKTPHSYVAESVAHVIWGSEVGYYIPYVIVVNDDVDPSDMPMVMHALATKCHPWRGVNRLEHSFGILLSPYLNRTERIHHLGAKAYFDCTWPLDWDQAIAVPPRASFNDIYPKEIKEHVVKNWKNYGF